MNEFVKEMGPPPVDVDQLSAVPPAQRKTAQKKAEAQTKKDYPAANKPVPPVKKAKGGVIRGGGCEQRGKTRGRMV